MRLGTAHPSKGPNFNQTSTKLQPRFEKASVHQWLSLYFFTQLFTSQEGFLTLINKIFKAVQHNYITYDIQVVASFSRIKTLRKGEGLGLALNQTKDRENKVFWQNQNIDQLKKPFMMLNMPTSAAKKTRIILHTSYLTSE